MEALKESKKNVSVAKRYETMLNNSLALVKLSSISQAERETHYNKASRLVVLLSALAQDNQDNKEIVGIANNAARLLANFAPSTGAPSTGEPSTGEPSTEEPTTEEPTTEEPTTEEPTTVTNTVTMSIFENFDDIPGNSVILSKITKKTKTYLAIYPLKNAKLLTAIKTLMAFSVAETKVIKEHNEKFTKLSVDELKNIDATFAGDAIKVDKNAVGKLKSLLSCNTTITRTNTKKEICQIFDPGQKLSQTGLSVSPREQITGLSGCILRAAIHRRAMSFLSKCNIEKRVNVCANKIVE